ncbi:MAG: leucyl aminopeptidase [Deltaproteobacteria bacterium]|nr:leucyl aminopeptidase [Deltaproteobacteria bacterium]
MTVQISRSKRLILENTASCLAVACDEGEAGDVFAPGPLSDLDAALGGELRKLATAEKFKGKKGQTLSLTTLGKIPSQRLLLLGVGPRADVLAHDLRALAGRAVKSANGFGCPSLALVAPTSLSTGANAMDGLQAAAEGALLGGYRFDKYLAEDKRTAATLAQIDLVGFEGDDAASEAALARARNTATAVARARDLVNEPAVAMTPTILANVAEGLAKAAAIDITVLGLEECRKENMGLFLAVAQGSAEPPRFIHMAYKPANAKKRIVLVGKGVTFDSGGLSLKPNEGMLDMKVDMAGSAAVISAIAAVAAEKLPIEVHALAACTENMPSGTAYRLGDVLRSKAGKTVEINNTDAEGRLTLADAITYGLALKPDQIFDFATLTGACVVALGPHIAGVMSNNKPLADAWLDAAKAAGEEMWPLPLPERLTDMLRSEVADMRNTGERWGGALTAGLFLKTFVGDTPWVHVDIAGPATADKDAGHTSKGGTGFAVSTILTYLRRIASV